MSTGRLAARCAIILACRCLGAQDLPAPPAQIDHILEKVRQHVQRLETSVPNFICKEQITSELFNKEKLKKRTRAESVLTTTRQKESGQAIFSENRADMSINGKPTDRNEIEGPFVWQGGPAYGDLHNLFNSDEGRRCRDYNLAGEVDLDGKKALLIKTAAASLTSQGVVCPNLPQDSTDKIWLDPVTLNVLQVESYDPPVTPVPGAVITLTVQYQPVVFDADEYWLPSHFISRLDFPGKPRHLQYEAFFSDYHKYTAESVIHIEGAQ